MSMHETTYIFSPFSYIDGQDEEIVKTPRSCSLVIRALDFSTTKRILPRGLHLFQEARYHDIRLIAHLRSIF